MSLESMFNGETSGVEGILERGLKIGRELICEVSGCQTLVEINIFNKCSLQELHVQSLR